MPATLTNDTPLKTSVGMGQIALGRNTDVLQAILGSCVGVTLFHPRHRVAVLAHVVLPSASGRTGLPGKFADTAIPEMLKMLALEGVPSAGIVAKLAGGANMLGNAAGPLQIGEANVAAITELLSAKGIRVIAKDLGGTKGRRMLVDCQTGIIEVEVVGAKTAVL